MPLFCFSYFKPRRLAAGLGAFVLLCPATAFAQFIPTPGTNPQYGNAALGSSGAMFDLGTRFLRHLGNEASSAYVGPPLKSNPLGGGADAPAATAVVSDRYRAWFEGYALTSRASAQGDFTGDRRTAWGGVAGIGATLAPGASVGFSVDQSRTKVSVNGLPQSATIDLTQLGANAAFESGNWTLGVAGVYGFGDVDTRRTDAGLSTASYDANLWGALAELSYLYSFGQSRIVPKIGVDWTQVNTDAFAETGGAGPVIGTALTSHRTRVFAGAEFGHTFALDHTQMFDVSTYARVVSIVDQDIGALQVTGAGATASIIQGVGESATGLDAGAAASWRLSPLVRLYAVYDGRFRSNFTAHSGALGLELRW